MALTPRQQRIIAEGDRYLKERMTGAARLPVVRWKGKDYFVDFRLGELRRVQISHYEMAMPIPFTEINDEKLKADLRMLQSRTVGQYYIAGLHD